MSTQSLSGAQMRGVSSIDSVDWNIVYAELLGKIYNYFRYRVGDGPLAEDLTATTFEKAWRKRRQYQRDRAAFSTWIFTIAHNTAIDYLRRHRDTFSYQEMYDTIEHEPSLEETVQRRQDFVHLSALLVQLPARERELISLKYGAGITNREIARLTNLSESNVGSILHRVVKKLRVQWKE